MKIRWTITVLLVFLSCFSCKSEPEAWPSVQEEKERPLPAVTGTPPEEAGGGDGGVAEGDGEGLPEVSLPPAEPSPEAAAELPEPAADLPQAGAAEPPPPGEPAGISLPEPAAGFPAEPPPPAPAAPPAPAEAPDPAGDPVTAVPAPAPLRPDPPPAPSPPPNLGPAEEEAPPAVVREPVPLPVNPVPEAPVLPPPAEEEIVYSRVVRTTVGQLVEIPFRGTGWVYLGELGSRRGVAYHSRRLDPEGQSFVFRAESPGTYGLKFYKQDFIRDYILNDYVQMIIGDPPETAGAGWFNPPIDRGRVVAEPRWPDTREEAEARRRQNTVPSAGPGETAAPVATRRPAEPPPAGQQAQSEAPDTEPPPAGQGGGVMPSTGQEAAGSSSLPQIVTDEGVAPAAPPAIAGPRNGAGVPETVPSLSPDSLPAEYLRRAREEFDAGRVSAAIGILDQFRDRFPAGSDEAWWLYGQFYEANSPRRDIRTALDYYRRLMKEYPQSGLYHDARRRIAWLERYYINIQ
jgi:hypothetical protein